ncbi:MAG: cobalamin-binding protein [Acidimicrobiales bacterium]
MGRSCRDRGALLAVIRAVSLVPSATETMLALGAFDQLVAVSDDCLAIAGASNLPVVSRALVRSPSAAAGTGSGFGIDAAVREQMEAGRSLYELDGELLARLAPDVVFAEDECSVCAITSRIVVDALARRGQSCRIVSLDPRSLEDVFASFETIASALGRGGAGTVLARSCRRRLQALAATAPSDSAPERVLVLDWVEPPYVAGNWVPDLLRAAGCRPVGVEAGARSGPLDLGAIPPGTIDAVVVAPCGLDLPAAQASAGSLRSAFPELAGVPLLALDGRAWFSRPGPGLVEGMERLRGWLRA